MPQRFKFLINEPPTRLAIQARVNIQEGGGGTGKAICASEALPVFAEKSSYQQQAGGTPHLAGLSLPGRISRHGLPCLAGFSTAALPYGGGRSRKFCLIFRSLPRSINC